MALLYMSCVSQQQLGTPDCHLYPFPNSTAEPYQLYLYGTLPVDRMEDSTRSSMPEPGDCLPFLRNTERTG